METGLVALMGLWRGETTVLNTQSLCKPIDQDLAINDPLIVSDLNHAQIIVMNKVSHRLAHK